MRFRRIRLQAAAAGLAVAFLVLGGCKQGGQQAGGDLEPVALETAAPTAGRNDARSQAGLRARQRAQDVL